MPADDKLQHATLENLRLPYRSFDSPTSTDAMWEDGRNCYANQRGYLERRPGFGATVEGVATKFHNVQRLFTWQRWDGTPNAGYYLMISDLDASGVSIVYKYKFGADVSAQVLFISGSSEPFDFIESNNWCFFGNAKEMMKWDGSHLYKWGIVAPTGAPSITTTSGYIAGSADTSNGVYYVYTYGSSLTGHESSSSPLSPKIVPGIQTKVVSTKVGLYGPVLAYYWGDSPHSGEVAKYLWCNPSDADAISAGATARTTDTASGETIGSSLLFDVITGSGSQPMQWTLFDTSGSGTSIGTQTLFPSKLEPEGFMDFNMCVVGQIYIPTPGTYVFNLKSKDGVQWGIGGDATWIGKGSTTGQKSQTMTTVKGLPLIPVSISNDGRGYSCTASESITFTTAGFYDIELDYDYWYHSGRTLTLKCNGLDLLPVTTTTSVAIVNEIGISPSSDPQVDQIHVYRTTVGGAFTPSKMQELPTSPYPNVADTTLDQADDTDLLLSYAPGFYSNNPPPPSVGFVWAQNRIWSFSGNTLYYSGFEEIIKGVPEECWPGGLDGNFHPYKRAIHALASMSDGVDVLTSLTHYGVEGDSLDTFRWRTLLEHRGTKSRTGVTTLGSSVLWFDTSKQVWSSGALSGALGQYQARAADSGELGLDIRPDLETMDSMDISLAVHIFGQIHWLIVRDGKNGKLWVLNLDTGQWQVPWTVPCTAILSGESADGQVDLMVALNGTTLVKLTPEINDAAGNVVQAGIFKDYRTPYDGWIRTNLFPIGKGESPAVVDYVKVERNAVKLVDVLQNNDDDTEHAGNYKSIFRYEQDPPQRGNGKNIIAKLYRSTPEPMNNGTASCMRASFEFHWGVSDKKFEMYSIDVAYDKAVGR